MNAPILPFALLDVNTNENDCCLRPPHCAGNATAPRRQPSMPPPHRRRNPPHLLRVFSRRYGGPRRRRDPDRNGPRSRQPPPVATGRPALRRSGSSTQQGGPLRRDPAHASGLARLRHRPSRRGCLPRGGVGHRRSGAGSLGATPRTATVLPTSRTARRDGAAGPAKEWVTDAAGRAASARATPPPTLTRCSATPPPAR
jgi:hypothetical protein